MDPELEELPTDMQRGLDFRIAKTSKGGYADYNTSKWARKESGLQVDELQAIETHDLYDLSTFLPKKPTEVELRVIKEMFEASVDGQPYDVERWGQYFRPAGVQAPAGTVSNAAADVDEDAPAPALKVVTPAAKPAPVATPAMEDEDEPAVASAPVAKPAGTQKAEDILAMIRARQQKQ